MVSKLDSRLIPVRSEVPVWWNASNSRFLWFRFGIDGISYQVRNRVAGPFAANRQRQWSSQVVEQGPCRPATRRLGHRSARHLHERFSLRNPEDLPAQGERFWHGSCHHVLAKFRDFVAKNCLNVKPFPRQ